LKRNHRFGNGVFLIATLLSAAVLAGCGGGGTNRAVSKTPTKATKARVQSMETQSFRIMAQSGVPNAALSAMRGGIMAGGGVAVGTGVGSGTGTVAPVSSANGAAPPVPLMGQFLNNIAVVSKSARSRAISRMQTRHAQGIARITRDDSSTGSSPGSPPTTTSPGPIPDPGPPPTFYYDDYLGLWVDIADTPTSSAFTLYEDEAKTKPAGSIVTTFPTGDTFPQIFASTYSFTAGSQAGSHGDYNNTVNQDRSGSSSYLDVYMDGGKDQGSSHWTTGGDYTWTGRTDNADKSYASMTGTFHADGSGAMHSEGSDGYVSDYTYRADGSGHAHISGPFPGLPVTITWDAQGNTTILYADGSSDFIPGWGYGVAVPVDGSGNSGSGVASSGTTTTVTPPTPPASKSARNAVR
jgi:hypothetical protein